jgi:ribosomal protein S18 acetylase RimI-like enzyme
VSRTPPDHPPARDGSRLDHPIWYSLIGPHHELAQHAADADDRVVAARYDPEVSPFGAVGDIEDPAGWAGLATLVGSGGRVVVMLRADATAAISPWPPVGWKVEADIPGVQMVARTMVPATDPHAVPLGPVDVPEMLDLVGRTRPGPFAKRTVELGGYVGFRVEGRLVAMAGQRFGPGGFTEISAVCTDADQRGRGLGGRLVRTVAAGIAAAGSVPFLHAASTNVTAIALYEKLGMEVRRSVQFVALRHEA